MTADRSSINKFLDALSRQTGSTPRGVAVRGGSTTPVLRVMELLGSSEGDAEVILNHLPSDPAVLAVYLRPRLVWEDG